MNALCLVAHPDDCVIFGLSYIYHHLEYSWTIGYLTYTDQDPRGQEFVNFWRCRNISTIFLGLEDHWHDNEQKQFTRWTEEHAQRLCWNLARQYDLVLTHNAQGDYGHIHHQLVHEAVQWHPNLVTFAPPTQGTVEYTVPSNYYSLSELPLHRNIIAGFHSQIHKNSYKELR